MDDLNVKAVIAIDDDYQMVKKKIEQEIINRINSQKQYQLVKLYQYRLDQEEEDKLYAFRVKETMEKYKNLGLQIFQTQQDIITGRKKEAQFTKEEISDLDKYFNSNNHSEQKAKNDRFASNEVVPINSYWFMSFKHFDLLKPHVKEKDDQILRNLQNIIFNYGDDYSFELKFEFRENEHFFNQYLVKSFTLNKNFEPVRTEGSTIEWFEGKDVCRKTVKKSQKNRKTGAIRIITHEVEDESFFNFFNSINLEEVELLGQKQDNSLINVNKFLDRMNLDFDIARGIIDELLPYNLEYYLDVRRIKPKNSETQDLNFLEEAKENNFNSASDDSDDDDDDYQDNKNDDLEQSKEIDLTNSQSKKNKKGKGHNNHNRDKNTQQDDQCSQY